MTSSVVAVKGRLNACHPSVHIHVHHKCHKTAVRIGLGKIMTGANLSPPTSDHLEQLFAVPEQLPLSSLFARAKIRLRHDELPVRERRDRLCDDLLR